MDCVHQLLKMQGLVPSYASMHIYLHAHTCSHVLDVHVCFCSFQMLSASYQMCFAHIWMVANLEPCVLFHHLSRSVTNKILEILLFGFFGFSVFFLSICFTEWLKTQCFAVLCSHVNAPVCVCPRPVRSLSIFSWPVSSARSITHCGFVKMQLCQLTSSSLWAYCLASCYSLAAGWA